MRSIKIAMIALVSLGFLPVVGTVAKPPVEKPLHGVRPIVIGHRGAAGYRPEHTLASYALAIKMGADFIEPDLVSTKDGALIARHEPAIAIVDPATGKVIEATTDVADHPEFADRLTTKTIDGQTIKGWFAGDFTLAEIKTLRAKERLPQIRPNNTKYDGKFQIPTLQEIIDLAKSESRILHRKIGIYPETKHPTFHHSIGLSLEEPLVKILKANGYNSPSSPVFIQSFETNNLKQLKRMTNVKLVQLLDESTAKPYDFVVNGDPRTYGDLMTPKGLNGIAKYAAGIGPWKRSIIPAFTVDKNGDGKPDDINGDGFISDADRFLGAPTTLVKDAHRARLVVHPYTFRSDNFFVAPDYKGDPKKEYRQFFALGVDGLFSDFPDTAFKVRNQCLRNFCNQ